MAECPQRYSQRHRRRLVLVLLGVAGTSFGPSFVGLGGGPKLFRRCRSASLQRSVSREEMLLSGEGAKVIEALPTVRQEELPLNTSIALAGIALFGYMSYQFWTRIAFGKAFGTGLSRTPQNSLYLQSFSHCRVPGRPPAKCRDGHVWQCVLDTPKEVEIAQLRHCRSGGHSEAGGGV